MAVQRKKIYIKSSGKKARKPTGKGGTLRKKPTQEFAPGDTLPQGYVVDQVIASGGSGIVLKAHKPSISPPIYKAVKVINTRDLQDAKDRDVVQQEFYGEAAISAQIGSDPYAISVEDILELADGTRVLVCPFIDGRTLSEILHDHTARGCLFPTDLTAFIFHRSLSVLDHAAERTIPHRDLSLSNVMVQRTGVPMLLDWGSAADVNHGVLIGKPGYLAPETIKYPGKIAEQSAFKADIFSLGALIRELLTGSNALDYIPDFHPDYDPDEALDFRRDVDTGTLAPLSEVCPDIPVGLSNILSACLQENPDDRPDAETLYDYLGQQYLYTSQVGFGITAETLKHYLDFFYTSPDPNGALPNDKYGRNLAKLINSKFRRMAEDPAYANHKLSDVATQQNTAYINSGVSRTFAEGFGQQPLDAAIRDTLISDIAKEFPTGLDNPSSPESAEFGRRTHGLKTMDPAQLRHSLARVINDETARTGYDKTAEYYSRVCHNIRGMSKQRGFLV